MKASACLRLGFGATLLAFVAVAAAQNATTTRPVGLHAGPDGTYPLVAQLDADTPVQVMGCLDDWSWCDVSVEDNRGWVFAPAITYEYEGGYVPLYSYAPSLGIPVVVFSIGDYWDRNYHGRPWYAHRDEWVHREPPRHERPPGPPPSASPPPRPVRTDRPREESHERPLRLGSAEPNRPETERERAAPPSHEDHTPPPEHAAPPSHAEHSRLPEHATSSQHEDRAHAPQRAEPPRHDEKRSDEKRSEPPHNDH